MLFSSMDLSPQKRMMTHLREQRKSIFVVAVALSMKPHSLPARGAGATNLLSFCARFNKKKRTQETSLDAYLAARKGGGAEDVIKSQFAPFALIPSPMFTYWRRRW